MKPPLKIRAGRYSLTIPEIISYQRGNDDFRDVWAARLFGNIDKETYYRMVGGVMRWDETMARKTYRIELKIDFNDDTRHDALMSVARQYARDLLGSAMLLQDGRKPACVLMTDDTFTGMEEIDILDPSENLHVP
jgi:hypothetical protein